ncbi:TetR/AcrR family transcriptional regulator [Antrihabitans stalactiti]|uniref:TetR/AcrR family transcriptional regulator n=1 Tax=Antrihabitans stalactiti TaxID=2584121 RepID=UPI0030B824EC
MADRRAAGTKGVPRAQREEQILDAAAGEFGRYGYAGAALSAIAAQAEVSKQLVLNYFGSKDGLFVACVERAGRNVIDPIERAISTGQGPVQTADDTLAAIFTGLQPRPHDWNVINDRTTPLGGPADAAARQVRTTIAAQAARGVAGLAELDHLESDDLSLLTDVWMSTVTALVGWWLRHPEQSAAQMIQRSRRIFAALNKIDDRK